MEGNWFIALLWSDGISPQIGHLIGPFDDEEKARRWRIESRDERLLPCMGYTMKFVQANSAALQEPRRG